MEKSGKNLHNSYLGREKLGESYYLSNDVDIDNKIDIIVNYAAEILSEWHAR